VVSSAPRSWPTQSLAHIALIVRDYDEAIAWFTDVLGFTLVANEHQPEQEAFIGNQAGGRVFLFLATDDFWRDYHALTAKGVRFVRPPAEQPYGTVAVFEDLYGNLWDLVQFAGRPARLSAP
jgi:catechol 2,3-dioxygenase-like lactoylglutathione lyase family enzyme